MPFIQKIYQSYINVAGKISRHQAFSLVKPFLKGNVLDVGCGKGGIAAFVSPKNYIGIDLSEKQLTEAGHFYPNHKFYLVDCSDKTKFAYLIGEKQFDIVLLLTLLEYVPDPRSLVENCKWLLRDSGRLIIATPSSLIGKIHGFVYRHAGSRAQAASYFDKRTIKELLQVSFTIESFKTYNLGLSYFVVARPKSFIG